VLSGHHDSAQLFNFYEDGGPYQQQETRLLGLFFLHFAAVTTIVVVLIIEPKAIAQAISVALL
jgi:hypothetical protein